VAWGRSPSAGREIVPVDDTTAAGGRGFALAAGANGPAGLSGTAGGGGGTGFGAGVAGAGLTALAIPGAGLGVGVGVAFTNCSADAEGGGVTASGVDPSACFAVWSSVR
jgi:hypothetical protein